LEESFEI
jgi:hypothetical protein